MRSDEELLNGIDQMILGIKTDNRLIKQRADDIVLSDDMEQQMRWLIDIQHTIGYRHEKKRNLKYFRELLELRGVDLGSHENQHTDDSPENPE